LPLYQILLFALFNLLQGGSGINSTLQSALWIPVEQYTTRRVSLHMFEHLHQ
jgi:ATP-binding cassette subfamily B (MDR/TAP) protein 6